MNITNEEIKKLEDCKSADDWRNACDEIKSARNGQYPPDWWEKVKLAGMMDRIFSRWGSDSELHLVKFIPGSIPNDVDGRDMRNDKTVPF